MQALAAGASIAVLLDLPADVAWFRAALEDHQAGHVVGGGGNANYLGPVNLVLGRCAAALDDLDAAADLRAHRRPRVRSGGLSPSANWE